MINTIIFMTERTVNERDAHSMFDNANMVFNGKSPSRHAPPKQLPILLRGNPLPFLENMAEVV